MLADAQAWYDRLTVIYGEQNIVVYGRSMGSGMAVPVAAHRDPRLLVLESPYADLLDVARNFLAILPYKWLLKYRFRNDVAMKRVKCPVYIFHGKRELVGALQQRPEALCRNPFGHPPRNDHVRKRIPQQSARLPALPPEIARHPWGDRR